jgi:hypothetical protein
VTNVKRFKTMCMHTIDGKPASFDGKDYIWLANGRSQVTLVPSLRELRRQQRLDMQGKTRESGTFTAVSREAYGYVLVAVPV